MNSAIIKEDCKNLLAGFSRIHDLDHKTFLITGSNGLIGNYFVNLLSVANDLYHTNIKAYCISKHDLSGEIAILFTLARICPGPSFFILMLIMLFIVPAMLAPKNSWKMNWKLSR